MLREVLKSKIHRATVTEADLNYEGSITIDEELLDKADIVPFEKLQIANINNGKRFETYCIKGDKKTGVVCLNGAAARLGQPGDKIIIISYKTISEEEKEGYAPILITVDGNNKILEMKP